MFKRSQKYQANEIFSLTFRGEKTLDPGAYTQVKRTSICYHAG